MSSSGGEFKWLSAQQAEKQLSAELSERDQKQSFIHETLSNFPELAEWYKGVVFRGTREPRAHVSLYAEEAKRHLGEMGIFGAAAINDSDIKHLGPLLARDEAYREDTIFEILHYRRKDVPRHMARYVTVNLRHIKHMGLMAQSGRVDLEQLQKDKTTAAAELVSPLIIEDGFEDAFIDSSMKRRVLRALSYIFTEPAGTPEEKLYERLKQQAAEGDRLSGLEIVQRVSGHVSAAHDRVTRVSNDKMETEETMVQLLEEARLSRLRELGRAVLAPGLEILLPTEG